MNEIIVNEDIESMIYEIRGVQVMLSSDVAKLYHVETKKLNQTIKRNINRFPDSFCFQLTNDEIDILSLRSQFVTLNKNDNMRGQHVKYAPYVLTEQGIMMLSGLLKSDIAVKVNIEIIDAFVKMRRYFVNSVNNNEILINHENRLLKLETTLDKMSSEEETSRIFFEGQIYDAYSLLIDILNKAKKEIIIIDNYAGKELLDILKDIKVNVTLISKNISETIIEKYSSQYQNVIFKNNDSFHDRFIIIDKKELYSSGSSFKDLAKKCFGIHKVETKEYLNEILKIIK